MIKKFNELYEVDLTGYIEKKPTFKYDKAKGKFVETDKKLDYISWVNAVILLHKHGAETVKYGNCHSEDGHSLFLVNGELPEVHVWVEVDGDRRDITYPLIDGSSDIKMDKITQSDIHNASQRAMVKCVAINWGLGLKLWQKEEAEDDKNRKEKKTVEDISVHNILKIYERCQQRVTYLLNHGKSLESIANGCGFPDEETFRASFAQFKVLYNFEKKLCDLQKECESQ
jgi:hypothetical protein